MSANHTTVSGSLLTSMITGLVALVPAGVLPYAEKVGSVFLLAVVAELGRRAVALLWKDKNQ